MTGLRMVPGMVTEGGARVCANREGHALLCDVWGTPDLTDRATFLLLLDQLAEREVCAALEALWMRTRGGIDV